MAVGYDGIVWCVFAGSWVWDGGSWAGVVYALGKVWVSGVITGTLGVGSVKYFPWRICMDSGPTCGRG